MTTWQPMPDRVFNSTGFMSRLGSSPHAWACTACARPISPPPGQTAALFDMFCALNGATRTPARANARHSAVTITLLPTSDAVPITIKLLALKTRLLPGKIHWYHNIRDAILFQDGSVEQGAN